MVQCARILKDTISSQPQAKRWTNWNINNPSQPHHRNWGPTTAPELEKQAGGHQESPPPWAENAMETRTRWKNRNCNRLIAGGVVCTNERPKFQGAPVTEGTAHPVSHTLRSSARSSLWIAKKNPTGLPAGRGERTPSGICQSFPSSQEGPLSGEALLPESIILGVFYSLRGDILSHLSGGRQQSKTNLRSTGDTHQW